MKNGIIIMTKSSRLKEKKFISVQGSEDNPDKLLALHLSKNEEQD